MGLDPFLGLCFVWIGLNRTLSCVLSGSVPPLVGIGDDSRFLHPVGLKNSPLVGFGLKPHPVAFVVVGKISLGHDDIVAVYLRDIVADLDYALTWDEGIGACFIHQSSSV